MVRLGSQLFTRGPPPLVVHRALPTTSRKAFAAMRECMIIVWESASLGLSSFLLAAIATVKEDCLDPKDLHKSESVIQTSWTRHLLQISRAQALYQQRDA
jgi:hypothetical protein